MKKLTSFLIVCLLLISCQSNTQDSKENDDISVKRDKFVQMAQRSNHTVDAKWENEQVLVITVEQNSMNDKVKLETKDKNGNEVYVDRAVFKATSMASLGKTITGRSVCVRVQYPDGQELEYKCSD